MGEKLPHRNEILSSITKIVLEKHGEFELKNASLRIIKYDLHTGLVIIRCGHKSIQKVKDALNIMTKPARIELIGISGTLKTLKRKFIK